MAFICCRIISDEQSTVPSETVTLRQESEADTAGFELTGQLMMSPDPSALSWGDSLIAAGIVEAESVNESYSRLYFTLSLLLKVS